VKKVSVTLSAVSLMIVLASQWAVGQIPPQMTPFSADMQFSGSGRQEREGTGKLYVAHTHMRMDMQGVGGRGMMSNAVMITNMATQTSDMLMPQQHMYMEFKAGQQAGPMGRRMGPNIKPLDPANPCANRDEVATCKNMGVEDIDGRSATHWQVTNQNGKVSNVWIDQKLRFPIKAVDQDSSWKLSNIKEGEPSASLFEIPSDYQKMDLGTMMKGMPQRPSE